MKYHLAHYIQHHIQNHIQKYKKIAYYYLSEQQLTTQLIVHKIPYTPLSFQKKSALSITDVFINIHFLTHFY